MSLLQIHQQYLLKAGAAVAVVMAWKVNVMQVDIRVYDNTVSVVRHDLFTDFLLLQTCAVTMNMLAGPLLFRRALIQMGEGRALPKSALPQDFATITDSRSDSCT